MQKCIRLTVRSDQQFLPELRVLIERFAKDYEVEGALYVKPDQLTVVVAGEKHAVDEFLDQVYRDMQADLRVSFEIEAALKDRDYRGVFRVIE